MLFCHSLPFCHPELVSGSFLSSPRKRGSIPLLRGVRGVSFCSYFRIPPPFFLNPRMSLFPLQPPHFRSQSRPRRSTFFRRLQSARHQRPQPHHCPRPILRLRTLFLGHNHHFIIIVYPVRQFRPYSPLFFKRQNPRTPDRPTHRGLGGCFVHILPARAG